MIIKINEWTLATNFDIILCKKGVLVWKMFLMFSKNGVI